MTFFVPGVAATAGSKRAYTVKKADGKIGVRCEDSAIKRGKPWRKLVQEMAVIAMRQQPWAIVPGRALQLTVEFVLPRPKGHYTKHRELKIAAFVRHHTVRPDATKLLRCLEDALTGVLWADDAAIVAQHVTKVYGETPGAQVTVEVVT